MIYCLKFLAQPATLHWTTAGSLLHWLLFLSLLALSPCLAFGFSFLKQFLFFSFSCPPALVALPAAASFCKLSPRAAALFAQQNVLKVKLIYKYSLPARPPPTAHGPQTQRPPLILNVTPGTHFDEIFRKKCLRSKNARLRLRLGALLFSASFTFWPMSWRVLPFFCFFLLLFSFLFLGAKLSPCGIHEAVPRLQLAAHARGRCEAGPSEAGEAQRCCRHWLHCCWHCFCFAPRRATMRGWQHGGAGAAGRQELLPTK